MGEDESRSQTDLLVDFVTGNPSAAQGSDVDPQLVRHVVIDTVAVMLAGCAADAGNVLSRLGVGGTQGFTCAEESALALGFLGHAYDFDDTTPVMPGHPSVPVLAAILALAGQAEDGDLISSYMIGVEVASKLGRGIGSHHYNRGWHSTGTHGAIGAAAGAARLLRLSPEETRSALAIAVSQASGLQCNFGTLVKPMHSGFAARNAVAAARLASAGADGCRTPIEGPQGYFDVYGGPESDAGVMVASLGAPWTFVAPGIYLKRYPCCFATHRPIHALRQIQDEVRPEPAEIKAIDCRVPVGSLRPLRYRRPNTGSEAKFSMEYVLSAQALDGQVDLDSFRDDQVTRPEIVALMERCRVVEDASLAPDDPHGERDSSGTRGEVLVAVELMDGRRREARVRRAPGGVDAPLSQQDVIDKFMMCADHASVEPAQRDELLDLLLEDGPLASIASLVTGTILGGLRRRAAVSRPTWPRQDHVREDRQARARAGELT